MKEAIGSTWTFQLMITFILIFACFLTLVISYSRAFSIKNETLSIIEKYEGVTTESLTIINDFLKDNAYRTTGKCENGWYGASDLEGNIKQVVNGESYYYCMKENKTSNNYVYYEVRFFYKFNLPVIGDITTFKVSGKTEGFIGSNSRLTTR